MIISKYNKSGCANLNITLSILNLMTFQILWLTLQLPISQLKNHSIVNLLITQSYGIFLNNVYLPNASTINSKAPIKAK